MERVKNLQNQLKSNDKPKGEYRLPRSLNKLDWFKNNGWGYKDTQFLLNEDGTVVLTGNKYQFSGQKMPKFKEWAERVAGLDVNIRTPAQEHIPCDPPSLNQGFMDEAVGKFQEVSIDDSQRIHHSHGHSLQEIFDLRYGQLKRVVDCVVFINSNKQAELLIQLAMKHDVVIIPYGGGTNVTQALMCNPDEKRMIISADVTRMNHVRSVDRINMTALVEAGILGQDLERELARYGVTSGHEPDSAEFSSMGGWVSTRASGMKKNKYGNIDDILLQVKIVTPIGTFTKTLDQPRVSSGPDLNQIVLGSEGTLGIITETVIKVKNLPKKIEYDSIIFYNFSQGTSFMYDVAQSRVWPASLRLVDNKQFQFGMALKTAPVDKTHELIDKVKKYFITEILNYNPEEMCLLTAVFEGSEEEISYQKKTIYNLAKKHKGFRAGPENGQRAYFLTYMIAYLRDYGFQFSFIAESFETSCSWQMVPILCENVKQRVIDDCRKFGVKREPFISFRVTQVYDTGAAVYVYFGFHYHGVPDPVKVYSDIEDGAREEIMKNGGSISHHHGVGKLRKQFLEQSVGTVGKQILSKIKTQIDPKNIFASGNLGI